MFEEYLTFLMANAWVAGGLTKQAISIWKEKTYGMQPREHDLFMAFRRGDFYDITLALGRPFHGQFPEYLAAEVRKDGGRIAVEKAAELWQNWVELGIMQFIAEKEGWRYKYTAFQWDHGVDYVAALRDQRKLMAWYEEASEMFPHYAVRQIYADEYPCKEDYFAAIQAWRDSHPAQEAMFGIPPELGDLEYDRKIRELFDAIAGDDKTKYNVFRFCTPFSDPPKRIGQPEKLYTALNRILRPKGIDVEDYYESRDVPRGFFWEDRNKIVDMYYSGEVTPELISQIKRYIDTCDKEFNKKELLVEGVRLLLRFDGYDPATFDM